MGVMRDYISAKERLKPMKSRLRIVIENSIWEILMTVLTILAVIEYNRDLN